MIANAFCFAVGLFVGLIGSAMLQAIESDIEYPRDDDMSDFYQGGYANGRHE